MFCTLMVFLFSPVPLWSQSAGGSISGYVYDATGAVVPDTTVRATNTDTGLSRTVKSDNRGYYLVAPLPVGAYDVVFTHDGFAELRRTGVYVEVGQSAALDARLKVGGAQETVVVTEATPLIEVGKTGAESVIVDTEIRELPLNNRNWNDLAVLLPGVSADAEFDSVNTVSINGQEGAFNNIQVDGVDNNNTFFAELRGRGRAPFQYSQEAVQEFRILNTAYLAEHGRSAGGVVNAVTKSGTNEWHGSGFWYIRDNALNAAPFFAKEQGLGKPEGRRQQFGGTIGGPLKRDKLFLFFSYDQQVRRDPVAIVFDAQTDFELNFDPRDVLNTTTNFSTNSNTFFDTVDGGGNVVLNFAVVSAFERDVVQQAFLNWAFARAYFLGDTSFLDQTFTIAGTNVTTINPFPGRQFFSVPRIGDRNPNQITFFPKITWIIGPNHNLSAQWNYQDFESGPNGIETQASQDENQSASGPEKNRSDAVVANLNSVFGPRWVNEFRFQYVRDDADTGANALGLPEIDIALFDLGGRGSLPRFTHEDKWQWQNNTSWLRGRHQVKFGADVVLTYDDNFFPGDFNGVYDIDGPGHWMELSRAFIALTNPVAGR
ncbi:MAG: carboxypeptidase regulatory-like domain-containing protein, partial [Terriglobales bacterium]